MRFESHVSQLSKKKFPGFRVRAWRYSLEARLFVHEVQHIIPTSRLRLGNNTLQGELFFYPIPSLLNTGTKMITENLQVENTKKVIDAPGWRFAVTSGILGWVLDAFDFFVVVFLVDTLASNFHVGKRETVFTISLTLAMRPLGALIFGSPADGSAEGSRSRSASSISQPSPH